MFAVFPVMRQLHELLWYLTDALTLQAARSLHADLRRMATETEELTLLGPEDLHDPGRAVAPEPGQRAAAEDQRPRPRESPRQEKDRRGEDLIGAKLRGADLRGVSLRGTLLIAADLRDADLRHAPTSSAPTSATRTYEAPTCRRASSSPSPRSTPPEATNGQSSPRPSPARPTGRRRAGHARRPTNTSNDRRPAQHAGDCADR